MNPLYEPLPKKVEVGGILYPIKTDFRAVLKLIGEVKQAEEPGSRLFLILRLYKNEIPPDIQPSRQSRISLPASGQQKRKKSVKAVESRRSAMRRMHRISSAISGTITALTCWPVNICTGRSSRCCWKACRMIPARKPASATVRSMPERSGTNRNASGSRRSSGQYPWKTSGMRNRSVTCSRLRCGETDKKMGGRKWQTEH